MRLRLLAPIACLSTCLCLAACGSDSSPTSTKTDPDDDPAYPPPNGTVTVDGKPLPGNISGLFSGDTSLTLTFNTLRNLKDTGWVLTLVTKPGIGTHPGEAFILGSVGSHYTATDTCDYSPKSASATLTAWSTQPDGEYRKGIMSGSASLDLTRWNYETGDCPDATVSVTFTNAEAMDWDRIGDILE